MYRRMLPILALAWCAQATANGTGGADAVAIDTEPADPAVDRSSASAESPKIQLKDLAAPDVSSQDLQTNPPESAKGIAETIGDKVTITKGPGGHKISSPDLNTDVGPVSVTPYVSGSVKTAPDGDKDVQVGAGVIIKAKDED